MRRNPPLHERPVLGPVVYFVSSVLVGGEGFVFGYLYTYSIQYAVYWAVFMETVLLLYLMACAREVGDHDRSE